MGSDSVEGDRRLLGRRTGDSEEEGLRGSESEEGGRRGLRARALGGSGGLRALGGGSESEEGSRTFLGFRLGAGVGGSESEEGSRTFLGFRLGAGGSESGDFLGFRLGAGGGGAGTGTGTGTGTGAATGTGSGALGLFRLPLGRPAFRFSGRASIYSWQYFYSYGRVITNSKDTACPLRSTISSAWSRIWKDKCRSSMTSAQ